MGIQFDFKDSYNVADLLRIMQILRAPGGCPWDAEQNHDSIKKNLIEETYEVIEAINKQDSAMLCEELGDVLLQVVFHTCMETEAGGFTFDDVADGICKKLIERHPHVFGDINVKNSEEVLSNWDAIKRRTKGQANQSSAMNSVPRELPALMRAEKIQSKAKKAGFDWPDISGAIEALENEVAELKQSLAQNDGHAADELGDVMFSAVNVARFLNVDAEETLTKATDKFVGRYVKVEALASERGIVMTEQPLEELDKLWAEAKTTESN